MLEGKFYIPVRSTIDLNSGKSETEMLEVTEEQYLNFLRPLAEIVAEDFVNELIKART